MQNALQMYIYVELEITQESLNSPVHILDSMVVLKTPKGLYVIRRMTGEVFSHNTSRGQHLFEFETIRNLGDRLVFRRNEVEIHLLKETGRHVPYHCANGERWRSFNLSENRGNHIAIRRYHKSPWTLFDRVTTHEVEKEAVT